MRFQENDMPVKDLQAIGLHDGKNSLLSEDVKTSLLKGELTDFISLKNIQVNNEKINIDAKLSLRQKEDGTKALLIHPIYAKKQNHPLLTTEENQLFEQKGTHSKKVSAYGTIVDFGKDYYQFNKDNKESFFVRLQKDNGQTTDIWGVDLERALIESKKTIGDKVQLDFKGSEQVKVEANKLDENGKVIGKEDILTNRNTWDIKDYSEQKKNDKTLLFEYDDETKSFVGVDSDALIVPETVNGQHLTPEQKREFKEGKAVTLPDDTMLQASPKDKNNLKSNRRFLIGSVLLDGGISFVMYHGLKSIFKNNKEVEQTQKDMYSKGYIDALNKVKADLQQKQSRYPNSKEISRDINILDKELSRSAVTLTPKSQEPSIDTMKAKVNDPELDDNALKQEKTETHSKQETTAKTETEQNIQVERNTQSEDTEQSTSYTR